MDCSLKKQSICMKEELLSGEYEINVENEFTLPDYYSSMKRVINCKTEPSITSKGVSGNILSVDGITGVKLIYLDNDEQLCCFESGFVFNKNIDIDFESDRLKIRTKIVDYKFETELKGERRFVIKGTITAKINVSKFSNIDCLCGENNPDFEIFKKKCTISESVLMAEKNIILEDEIELSDSHATISRIINYYGKIYPDECKIMNGKIMLKGILVIHITYMSDNSYNASHYEQKIPYSQVCDIDNIDDRYCCKTEEELVFLEVKSRNSGYDESRAMTVNAKICVNVEAELCDEKEIVLDIFSIKKEVKPEFASIENLTLLDRVKDNFSVKKNLEFSEGTFGSVVDTWSSVKIGGVKCSNETATAFGIIYIKLIVCTQDNTFEFFERAIDFEYRYNSSINLNDSVCEIKLDADNPSYIITSNCNLDVVCDIRVTLDIYKKQYIKIATDTLIEGENTIERGCAVNVCYFDSATDLWSIAKKYKSRISDLIEINSLDKEETTVKGMILIPIK